jgi:hypothetical protein
VAVATVHADGQEAESDVGPYRLRLCCIVSSALHGLINMNGQSCESSKQAQLNERKLAMIDDMT